MPAHEATSAWVKWACALPERCPEQHCARCGEHVGGQGHAAGGFLLDGRWYRFARATMPMSCDPEAMAGAIIESYSGEPWVQRAIEMVRKDARPDRRLRALTRCYDLSVTSHGGTGNMLIGEPGMSTMSTILDNVKALAPGDVLTITVTEMTAAEIDAIPSRPILGGEI